MLYATLKNYVSTRNVMILLHAKKKVYNYKRQLLIDLLLKFNSLSLFNYMCEFTFN